MATLEDSTFAEKHFLSSLTESAASSVASVRTGTEDGVLLFDSSLTLVNAEGTGTTFSFGYTHDTESLSSIHMFPGNEHESLGALRDDIETLLAVVDEWGRASLNALYDFHDAAQE